MILVLVFGASRLPAIGESLGRSVRNLKRAFSDEPRIGVTPKDGTPAKGTDAQSGNTAQEGSDAAHPANGAKQNAPTQDGITEAELVPPSEKRSDAPQG